MDYIKIYANFLQKFLKPQKRLKVIFDCSNGTTGPILKKIFSSSSPLSFFFLNDKPDGNFPAHGPDPLKQFALRDLRSAVLRQKADIGIIFDADGDRAFFVDNLGRFVDPDVIARLLIWHLKPKKLIVDVRTGWLVRKFRISNFEFRIFESRVGHYFIKKLMRKTKADLAVEYSGHYYFKKFFYADSGILAALEVINAVSKLPYSLADFSDLLPPSYRFKEINLKIEEPPKALKKLEKELKARYPKLIVKISWLDGLTMEFNDWWFNLRPSNTEPLIRLNIEANSKELLIKKAKELQKILGSL